ncbi:hypothetical protein BH09BAC2_BH09BAC2_06290 [soil metagenome]
MKTLYYLLFFIFFSYNGFTQAPTLQWQKSVGSSAFDYAYDVIQTNDGGAIAVGFTQGNDYDISGNHGMSDGLVIKYSNTGIIEWKKCYGSSLGDNFNHIIQTTDGGYMLAGTSDGNDGDVSGNHGQGDAWIVKINNLGSIEWSKCYGSSGSDGAASLLRVSDGYVIAGNSTNNDGDVTGNHGGPGGDGWIFKIDNLGVLQWQKCYGGSEADDFRSIDSTSGGFIIAGLTGSNNGDVSGFHGYADYWIVKINTLGDIIWQKCLGGTNEEQCKFIQHTTDGGYIVGGDSRSSDGDVTGAHGNADMWIVKLNSIGVIQWQRALGSGSDDNCTRVFQLTDGNYALSGASGFTNGGDIDGSQQKGEKDFWILKINEGGSILWQKIIGSTGTDLSESMCPTNDGGFLMTGYISSADYDAAGNVYHGNRDIWVVKLAANPVPVNLIDFTGAFQINRVVLKWETSTNVNPSYEFIIQSSDNGIYFKTIGAIKASDFRTKYRFEDKSFDQQKNLYYRLKIVEYNQGYSYSNIIKINLPQKAVSLYPNPVHTTIYFKGITPGTVSITDISGKQVLRKAILNNELDISHIVPGSYYIEVKNIFGDILIKQVFLIQ